MITALYILFCFGALPYVVFVLFILYRLKGNKKWLKGRANLSDFSAPVSVILVAFNEEKHVARKLNSLLAEENWIAGSEILVFSGGSTDATERELLLFKDHPAVHLHLFEERVSKIRGINQAVRLAKEDILIFSDFRQEMKRGSLQALVRNFSDPNVGTVAANLLDSKGSSRSSFERTLMNRVAFQGGKNDPCLNLSGALFAQRKDIFTEIPEDVLFDDLYVLVCVLGKEKLFVREENAVLYDFPFQAYYDQERIMRLARGLLLFISQYGSLIRKIPFRFRVQFLLFKYLKLLFPFSFLILFLVFLVFLSKVSSLAALSIMVFLIALATVKTTRQLLVHILEFHIYFGWVIFKFMIGKQRSVFWEKLKIDR